MNDEKLMTGQKRNMDKSYIMWECDPDKVCDLLLCFVNIKR